MTGSFRPHRLATGPRWRSWSAPGGCWWSGSRAPEGLDPLVPQGSRNFFRKFPRPVARVGSEPSLRWSRQARPAGAVPALAAVVSTSSTSGSRLPARAAEVSSGRCATSSTSDTQTTCASCSQHRRRQPDSQPAFDLARAVNPPRDRRVGALLDSPAEGQTLGYRVADVPNQARGLRWSRQARPAVVGSRPRLRRFRDGRCATSSTSVWCRSYPARSREDRRHGLFQYLDAVTSRIDADYLVVGAGAMGMAFTDALVDHAPDVRVALVDRRHGVGGHWLEAYPFVQLHQSSTLLRRRVDGARRRAGAGARAGDGAARAGRPARDPRLLRQRAGRPAARVGAGRVLPGLRLRRRPHRRLAGVRASVRGPGRLPGGRRALPRSRHPGRAAAEVRRRRRRPGGRRSTTSCTSRRRRASTSSWARARPPPTPASGCWRAASTRARSAGCAPATRGCSTAR